MSVKSFIRTGAWYQYHIKELRSDIEITSIVDNSDPLNPVVNVGGGSVTIPDTSYADNATALAALGTGKLYKSTTLINGSPIILLTV